MRTPKPASELRPGDLVDLEELKHVLPGLQHQGDKIARALQRARDRDDSDAVRRLSGEFGTVVGLRQRIELALRSRCTVPDNATRKFTV